MLPAGQKASSGSQQRVRILENKLDKAMIKFNEALSINTTYQQIMAKLKEERNAYDNQLQRLEDQVKQKDGEL